MNDYLKFTIHGTNIYLKPNDIVRLGRFELTKWKVCCGWYSWGGNRPVCGWYLVDIKIPTKIKPLQLPDLDDIYVVQHGQDEEVDSE